MAVECRLCSGTMGIVEDLLDARARTLSLALDLDDERWLGPEMSIVNPLAWELGHVAWFQEYWTLRRARGAAPLRSDGDALYDSSRVAHDTRWKLALPDRAGTLAYLAETLARSLAAVEDGKDLYFHRLALFHEDMHDEAFTYTRQTLGYAAPAFASLDRRSAVERAGSGSGRGPLNGDVEIPGARFFLGATASDGFVFDNEKWAHPVDVAMFRLARAPVTNEQFASFVDARGYQRRELWSDAGWQWRSEVQAEHPVYWIRRAGSFDVRRYDGVVPLEPYQPVVHVSWYEAEAYCRWAKRRLPTEAEWELASSTTDKRRFPWGEEAPSPRHANVDGHHGGPLDVAALPDGDSAFGCRQMIGNVWEWTASDFGPYPGFVVDPYAEYSAPWFATPHKVLRGGCWATRGRLLRNTWRNFYPPHRRDVLGGFRTCALDSA
jgi:iron(II)-dependent oxidoreductase